ncbi:hypothetical protein RclHR1_09990005 [Rhizophagus clarus]|uniref:Protein kinase domain-containing protein n=1 Tax=Rhizophagus clarus TaxID=94130 RepID=A0A2Z6SIR3_9GLOM|nr:hypothetical protein RclHR1_09990005 [Rhizophagus clarus]GES87239.1 hypothetical protein GLOIN_2v1869755 [Rhizophagus clarus]
MAKINYNFEKLISEGYIEHYEYSDFNDIQPIGRGSFGSVSRATWKNTTRFFALKSFNNDKQTYKEIVKELTIHRKVDIHENILRLYGITSVKNDETHQMEKYFLVLEYADSDTLDTYLKNHFNELNWNDKLLLAFQLASAVECIHCCGIIHRDLHAKNILVHQKNIKLADFGLSKKIAEESSNASKVFGVIPYIDPKSLNDQQYKLNEKSDIYSIGVLMWQISSGLQPFKDKGFDYDMKLSVAILNGLREEIVNETPIKYSNLYEECWKYEPNNRPIIQKVALTLKAIITSEHNDIVNENISGENGGNSLRVYQPDSKSINISNVIPDINEHLSIGSSINVNFSNNNKSDGVTQDLNYIQLNLVESKSSSSNVPIEMIDSISRNLVELELEEDGFITSDEKAKELTKKLTETRYLHALKLLFENLQNEFSPQILRDTLVALADPTPFDYYTKQNVARLELHLRTWVEVLERICFSPICLSRDLQDKVLNSLTKFAEIYHKTTQIMDGFENNFKLNFDQLKDNVKNRNYNIDFLLIHLRDTLNSLRDDETWIQEIIRKTKELLKVVLNIVPGILSETSENTILNDNCSVFTIITQLRQDLSFKYPVAPYYIDWRIMLIIQHNLLNWSDSSERIFNKKFGEMVLMEYIWGFMEREWNDVADKSILNSQIKFDELSNRFIKSLKNTSTFLNKSLALPHNLWFGILDLAQNLISRSTHASIHGLGYYLAIESLNKAPSSFIQFKAIEILLLLSDINNKLFSMVEIDFDQYTQKLDENNLETDHFENLLMFAKEISLKNFEKLNSNVKVSKKKGKKKEKAIDQNSYSKKDQISNYNDILDTIADEMICPISSEPTNQLCILNCLHILSLNNFRKLRQKKCPKCRKNFEDNDIRYISQNTIYKNLYSYLFEAGYFLPSIELEDSNNQYNSDSDNSEAELILIKKRKFIKTFKFNSNISLQSIFPRTSKKQHPTYQNTIKELNDKNYKKAEYYCKEFLQHFPTDYTMKCILAYIYRYLNSYKQAYLCLEEAINLKEKKPIAYFICGELFFKMNDYDIATYNLNKSLRYKAKINNLHIILGNINLFKTESCDYGSYLSEALRNYYIVLQNDPKNYLCLKNSAYIYDKLEDYSNALKMLDKLLNINKKDSLILCYYGEILCKISQYSKAISYFTKANLIDPENVHNLNKRAIAYYNTHEYHKSLLDLGKTMQLNPSNSMGYFYKILLYITKFNHRYCERLYYIIKSTVDTAVGFEKYMELEIDIWSHLKTHKLKNIKFNINNLGIIKRFNKYMFIVHKIYFISNLINLDGKYCQFKEANANSLIGNVLSFKNKKVFKLSLLEFSKISENNVYYQIIWKLNITKASLSHRICFIKFIIKKESGYKWEYILKYADLSKFEKLGWIEFILPYKIDGVLANSINVSIELNGHIDLQIDYIRFAPYNQTEINYVLLNYEDFLDNVPETFKDKYFSKKEMENLLELKDIIG